MSATTITQTATTSPKRSFRRRYTVAQGTAYQVWGLISGSALLALATQLKTGAGATALMIVGFVTVYLNCHALAHYLAGRAVGLRFRGYGVRGTDHPEVYPPGIRQLMQAAPFYVDAVHQGEPRAGKPTGQGDLLRRRRDLDRDLLNRLRGNRRSREHPRRPAAPRRDDRLQRHLDDRHHPQPHRRLRQGAPRAAQLTATGTPVPWAPGDSREPFLCDGSDAADPGAAVGGRSDPSGITGYRKQVAGQAPFPTPLVARKRPRVHPRLGRRRVPCLPRARQGSRRYAGDARGTRTAGLCDRALAQRD